MTDASVRYVGLDVHKRVVEACLVDTGGKVVQRERFALNRHALSSFITNVLRPGDRVALEATTNCWAVADTLRPHVAQVVVSNPMATQAIARAKVKTDKVDAHVLAQLLRCDFLPEVWQPDEATRRLRELCGRRSALIGQRTKMRNRIHSVLAMRLIDAPVRVFNFAGLDWLQSLELDAQGRLLIDVDLRQLAFLEKEMEALDDELAKRGYASDAVRLLVTLPSIDVTTANAMMAAWGDPQRFPDGDHAASALGLVPSTKQSAEHCYHGPITKQGNTLARWMLIEAAQHLDKHPGPLGQFFRRLLKKKNRNVAVTAGARKLAVIGWKLVTTGQPYRYAVPNSTAVKLSRLRMRATGQRHKSGSPKGTKCMAKLPGGSRTIKPLAEVYRAENVPALLSLSPGEQRTVEGAGCANFLAAIAAAKVLPRRARAPQTGDVSQHDTAPHNLEQKSAAVSSSRRLSEHQASCQVRSCKTCKTDRFRPHRAGEQGDEAPPPAPPTLSSIPRRKRVPAKKHTPAS